MTTQRDRVYELVLGDTKTGDAIVINSSLQLTFEISKSSDNKRGSNSASIEVYNLSPSSIQKLETEYLTCTFKVGYKETGPLVVVQGNVVETKTVKRGVDYITQIIMGEGYTELNHTKLKSLIGPGETIGGVIEEIRKQMPGVVRGSIVGANLNNPVLFGYPLTGTPAEMLRQVCEANRLEYNISGGVLNVSDENGLLSKNQVLAPVVSEQSGLIDVPFYTSAEGRKLPKDKKRRRGVEFKSLLNAEYNPGFIVIIKSKVISGTYRINSSRFTGDFRGGEWYVECFCSDVYAEDLKEDKKK
ncbi:putative structural protein [Pseudomonas phage phiK7A1]|uniref:Putative structural protein n=1 Tax=Pseudomonas phage phiK7A1 TaxID=2759194 RepID=A0A7H0XFT1_9CAUD|nr:putative structural protein [Pseudomonas phage phiK7A1]